MVLTVNESSWDDQGVEFRDGVHRSRPQIMRGSAERGSRRHPARPFGHGGAGGPEHPTFHFFEDHLNNNTFKKRWKHGEEQG